MYKYLIIPQNNWNFLVRLSFDYRENGRSLDKLNVYPNPTKNDVTIELSNFNGDVNYRLQIMTLEGKQVLEQILLSQKVIVNTAQLTKGSYLVRLFKNSEQSEETVLIIQ